MHQEYLNSFNNYKEYFWPCQVKICWQAGIDFQFLCVISDISSVARKKGQREFWISVKLTHHNFLMAFCV